LQKAHLTANDEAQAFTRDAGPRTRGDGRAGLKSDEWEKDNKGPLPSNSIGQGRRGRGIPLGDTIWVLL